MPIIKGTSTQKPKKPKSVQQEIATRNKQVAKSPELSQADINEALGSATKSPTRGTASTRNKVTADDAVIRGSETTGFTVKSPKSGGKGSAGGGGSKPGPWKSGDKVGQWEAGGTGKWAQGATGKWERAGNTYGGGSKGGGGGGGTRPRLGGALRDPNLVGSGGRISYSDGEEYSTGSDNITEDGFGGGGGGGTGNPLAGVSSALKSTSIKGSKIEGMSVEEAVKGAKRTRKTGAKRTQ